MAFLFWSSPAHARSSTSTAACMLKRVPRVKRRLYNDASLMTVKCLKKVEPACRVE